MKGGDGGVGGVGPCRRVAIVLVWNGWCVGGCETVLEGAGLLLSRDPLSLRARAHTIHTHIRFRRRLLVCPMLHRSY